MVMVVVFARIAFSLSLICAGVTAAICTWSSVGSWASLHIHVYIYKDASERKKEEKKREKEREKNDGR